MGNFRRELGRTLGLFSMPMMLGGCSFVFGLALCQSVCGEDDPVNTDLILSIVSPAQNTEFDNEAITVDVEVANNVDGVTVTLGAGTAATQIHLDPGESEGTLTITPASDSGYIFLVAGAFSDADPTTLASTGRIGILWSAPWLAGPIFACGISSCAPLADDATLTREAHLGGAPVWDNARLDHVDLTIDGVAPKDLNLLNEDWWFDTEIFDDGEVTLSVTVVRDDGLEANVTRQISVANCPRARPDAQYYLAAYAADGTLWTGASEMTYYDLRDGSSNGAPVVNGVATAIARDEVEGVIYFGVAGAGPSYRLDYYNFAGLATVGGVATPVLSLAAGPDGYVYWTEGVRGATPVGAIWRKDPDLIAGAARVDVGGLPGADGLVFDTDGTLLVAAGDTIHRLTLTAGVETARAPVYTRSGATLTQIARDGQGRLYVTDKTAGELVRYTLAPAGAEVLYTQTDWSNGGANEPWSLSFLEYPQRCYGLLITRQGLDDARRIVDVGPVRGAP